MAKPFWCGVTKIFGRWSVERFLGDKIFRVAVSENISSGWVPKLFEGGKAKTFWGGWMAKIVLLVHLKRRCLFVFFRSRRVV